MYYYIKGTLALLAGDTAVIDAGGIGYRLTVTQNTFAALASKLGKEAQLFTYLAVRDDAMELYGFASEDEKLFFTKLLGVSGIGPKAAVSVLSAFTPNQLVSAVQAGDAKMISRANGIGLKTAQKVIIELKGKLDLSDDTAGGALPSAATEAVNALTVLGYTRGEAAEAVKGIDGTLALEEIIALALKKLNRF